MVGAGLAEIDEPVVLDEVVVTRNEDAVAVAALEKRVADGDAARVEVQLMFQSPAGQNWSMWTLSSNRTFVIAPLNPARSSNSELRTVMLAAPR